jgi:hypothetical protein
LILFFLRHASAERESNHLDKDTRQKHILATGLGMCEGVWLAMRHVRLELMFEYTKSWLALSPRDMDEHKAVDIKITAQ